MDDRSSQVLGVAITFLVLCWITVALRCYARAIVVKAFGLDDAVMLTTLFTFTAYLTCQIGGAVHGTGKRRKLLTDESAQTALHFWFFCEIFYTISTSLLKIAVGLFLLRIAVKRLHIWIIWTIMVIAGLVGTTYTMVVIFQCRPISYWWTLDPTAHGSCIPATLIMNFTFSVSALNSFADWTFGLLPILIIKDLQMKRRVKIVVSGVIALAAIASTATIIRLPYTKSLGSYKGELLYDTVDFALWTTIEVGIGITAGSIATLKPLVKDLSMFRSTRGGSNLPWSRNTGSKFGNLRGAQQLDELTPTGGKTITKITFTGTSGGRGSDSDEEGMLGKDKLSSRVGQGINKSVTTTVVHEKMGSQAMRAGLPRDMSRPRPGTTPEDHDFVLGYEERSKAHERF
ncbi:hypothetical protein DM02DRAFT_249370 [Periconia macrospinosa]|uniref:Rhodopsin domain-containing protein n=1 Tax=Periconia macrospinosa TaxID=97972 RepID=A0A2V1D556_9PLEO|nr:hypothetical protein DM02DRAFT_249370 [Periconia macrospinosa]